MSDVYTDLFMHASIILKGAVSGCVVGATLQKVSIESNFWSM